MKLFFRTSFLLMAITLAVGSSCNFHLTPPYSQTMVDKVTAAENMNGQLYDFISSQPAPRHYEQFIPNYDNEETMIVEIRQIDSARVKPGKLLIIDQAIYERFVGYRKAHADEDTISADVLGVYKRSMDGLWKDRYEAEIHLKKP